MRKKTRMTNVTFKTLHEKNKRLRKIQRVRTIPLHRRRNEKLRQIKLKKSFLKGVENGSVE